MSLVARASETNVDLLRLPPVSLVLLNMIRVAFLMFMFLIVYIVCSLELAPYCDPRDHMPDCSMYATSA